jgi:hypothetical protein
VADWFLLASGHTGSDYRIMKDLKLYLQATVNEVVFLAELSSNEDILGETDLATEGILRQRMPRIAETIQKLNTWIPDPEFRVRTVFSTERLNEYVLVSGTQKPVLLLTRLTTRFNLDVAAHEMGHAVLWPYETLAPKGKLIRALGCIWSQLRNTILMPVLADDVPVVGVAGLTQPDRPVGHLLFDPSRWSPESNRAEHPWDNFAELFTSAFEAYNVAPMRLMASLDRAKQEDPAVFPSCDDLIAILDAMDPEHGRDPATLNGILDTVLARTGCSGSPKIKPAGILELRGDQSPNEYDYLLKPSLLLRDRGTKLE